MVVLDVMYGSFGVEKLLENESFYSLKTLDFVIVILRNEAGRKVIPNLPRLLEDEVDSFQSALT